MKQKDNEYVLAMYDIRGKQEYIYKSNKIKEIVGGSAIIRDCFKDYLYKAAKDYRNEEIKESEEEAIFDYNTKGNDKFSVEKFKKRMEEGTYIGEVVYNGGGNFFVLFKNKDVCEAVNKIFTKNVIEKTYSLKVLCTFIEGVNFEDYKGDRTRLYAEHRKREAMVTNEIPAQVLPFTQVDRMTSLPLYKKYTKDVKMSKERLAKCEKYNAIKEDEKETFGEELLDNLVTQKGEESLLAVVYIDGNSMGAKVQNCLGNAKSYEECVKELRAFSASIQRDYVDSGMKKIDEVLKEKYGNEVRRRFVIYAGDEINFICNARDAYIATRAYLENLKKVDGASACAGIAIFHSHAPYSEAYRIAEECCESGKTKMKEDGLSKASFIDVHYCQSGIGIDLDTIRKLEVGNRCSKPWFVSGSGECKQEETFTTEMVEAMVKELENIARTNIKSLASYAKDSIPSLKMEIKRIIAHSDFKEKPDIYLEKLLGDKKLDDEKMSKLIYDIIILYDLWFKDLDRGTENESKKS